MKERLKVALDVDDVLAAFTPHAHTHYGKELIKLNYWCSDTMEEHFGKDWFVPISQREEFWKTLPVLSDAKLIDFEFDYYISSFPIEMYDARIEWLMVNGFPNKELIVSSDKLKTCIELGVNVLIDDKPSTIESLNGSGVLGIHFINEYAGFMPVGDYIITNLDQVKGILEEYEEIADNRTC